MILLVNKLKLFRGIEFVRTVTSSSALKGLASVKALKQHREWSTAISEAEKVVGYSNALMPVRSLLSDEISNVASHIQRLVGSRHPLVTTANNLMYDDKSSMWGLIVLLLSKAISLPPNTSDVDLDKNAGVLHSQRALAEITEMIRSSHLMHQGIVNLQTLAESGNELPSDSDLIFGNKVALLTGDYLLGRANMQLAELRNHELSELISTAVRDMVESNFIGDRDDENNPLPYDPKSKLIIYDASHSEITKNADMSHAEKEWTFRHTLSSASLLAKSCKGTLKLAGQSEELQRHGFSFGMNLALAWQACLDLEPFRLQEHSFSLIGAPILFHLENDPALYEEIRKGHKNIEEIDFGKIYEAVLAGSGIERTRELQTRHGQEALNVLHKFPNGDAKRALQNIILAICG